MGTTLPSVIVLTLAAAGAAAAQTGPGQGGPRRLLPREAEIALARSAAPAEVSADATILVRESGGRYATAVEGTNGVTCYVARDWPESIEPHCFDAEGSRTILPIHLRRAELLEQGRTLAEIERDRDEGLREGRFQLPQRPVLSYMLSAGQVLYDDDGRRVGSWQPHLMIYFPNLTAEGLGLTAFQGMAPAMLDDDGPASSIVIPVPDFVAPGPEAAVRP